MSGRGSELREQFLRDGKVEFDLKPVKVAAKLAFLVGLPAGFVWMFLTEGIGYKIFAVLAGPTIVVLLGSVLAEGLFGKGPAFAIDRDGITLRKWREPLRLPWSDIRAVLPYGGTGKRKNTVAAIYVSSLVWADYQATRPAFARFLDRGTLAWSQPMVTPPKMLDRTHRDIVDAFDPAFLDELAVPRAPYKLVLDLDLDNPQSSPLWMRGERQADLAELPLSTSLRVALTQWRDYGYSLLDREADEPAFEADLQRWMGEGRALVVQVSGELGTTADVRYAPDLHG